MFSQVKIENFRGIEKLEIDDLKQFNLFVGENNACKTSVIEALFYASSPLDTLMPYKLNMLRAMPKMTQAILSAYFYAGDLDSKILLDAKFDKFKEHRNVEISVEKNSFEKEFKKSFKLTSKGLPLGYDTGILKLFDNLKLSVFIKNTEDELELEQKFSIVDRPEDAPEPLRSEIQNYFNVEQKIKKNIKKEQFSFQDFTSVIVPSRLFDDDNVIADRFDNAIKSNKLKSIITILKKIEPNLKNLVLTKDNSIWCDLGKERLFPVKVMGDGILRILYIILAIVNVENGFVFIDEIENGLHYHSLGLLWKMILKTAKEFNVQVFATTHSLECVQELLKQDRTKKKDDIRLFRLERYEGKLQSVLYTEEVLKSSIESGWEVR